MNGATARFSDFRCAVAGLHVGGVRASDQRHQVERIAHTPTHRHTRKLGTQQINRIIVIRKKTLFPKKNFPISATRVRHRVIHHSIRQAHLHGK